MPDIQAQTADGVVHSFPDGTPDEVVDRVIKKYQSDANTKANQPDALTRQTRLAAAQAGESSRPDTNIPTPKPTSTLTRLGSGLAAGADALIPKGMPDTFDQATAGMGPIPSMVRGGVRGFQESRNAGQGILPSIGSGLASTVGLDAPGIRERAKQGDVAGVVGEAIPSIATTLLAPEVADRVGARIQGAPDAAIPDAHQTILDLSGKTPADLEFTKRVKQALPDIAHAARTGGELQLEGNARVGELHERLQGRLDDIWHEEHQPQVERHAQMPLNLEDSRSSAQAAITPELRANNPTAARAADRWIDSALSDEASGTLGQADKMLRGINAEIPNLPEPFKNTGKLVRKAAGDALRSTIDDSLHAAGEEGVKGPNTRWGALKEVTDAIGDRLNNAGNRPYSIYDSFKGSHRLASVGAGLGGGLGEAVAGPAGAGVGVVAGGAAGVASSMIHDLISEPGHRAAKAFDALGKSSLQPDTVGTPDYVGKEPIGLLPAAPSDPLITPAPRGLGLYANEAGVRGVDARHVEAYNPVGGPGQRNLQRPEYTGGKGRTDYPIPRPGSLTKPLEAPGPAALDNQAVQSTVAKQAPEVPVERRASSRVATAENSAPVDNIRLARMDSLRKIVRDTTTPARDKAIAQSQLEDMEANPEERNTLGDNPSQLKKEKPLMSREEAEAASAKRTEGRTARFAERPAESPGPAELESKTSKRTKSKKGKK